MKLDIIDMGMNFEGVARLDGKVYFVPNAIVGEVVEAEVRKDQKKFATAQLKEVTTPSVDRVTPFCPYFGECGGCDIQHIAYDKQLELKTKLVQDTIKKVADITLTVNPTVASANTYFYRNKGAFPVGRDIGMFEKNSHNIVPIQQCMLMNDNITIAFKIVKQFLAEQKLLGYDHSTHTGVVKNVVVRSVNNQTLVCIVATKQLNLTGLYERLKQELQQVGLYQNINKQNNSTILGQNYIFVDGIKSITLKEFDVEYQIDVASFLQVNTDIKTKIYSQVIDEIGGGIVIDAYAGAGLLSSIMSKRAKKVYSVEIVSEASKMAQKLIDKNGIKNVEVICGDCTKVVPEIVKKIKESFAIVLDPARVGCSEDVIKTFSLADKIVYISCNPIALSKDLKVLSKTHNIEYVQPFDMFPETRHVETVVVLTKK